MTSTHVYNFEVTVIVLYTGFNFFFLHRKKCIFRDTYFYQGVTWDSEHFFGHPRVSITHTAHTVHTYVCVIYYRLWCCAIFVNAYFIFFFRKNYSWLQDYATCVQMVCVDGVWQQKRRRKRNGILYDSAVCARRYLYKVRTFSGVLNYIFFVYARVYVCWCFHLFLCWLPKKKNIVLYWLKCIFSFFFFLIPARSLCPAKYARSVIKGRGDGCENVNIIVSCRNKAVIHFRY